MAGRAGQAGCALPFGPALDVLAMRPPVVEVHIVPSAERPSGVGEPGVPPIAPAVANAVFAASGKRLRDLPLKLGKAA